MIVSRLDADGKLALPSDVLEELGFESGDELRLRVEEGRLIVENADDEEIVQAAIGRYLKRPPGQTHSIEEVEARLHTHMEALARKRDAA